MTHQIIPIIDRFANCTQLKILHRAIVEIPVDLLSDKNLDQYSAASAIASSYPGAVVRQIRRIADG